MIADVESDEYYGDGVAARLIRDVDHVLEVGLLASDRDAAGLKTAEEEDCDWHGCFYGWSAAVYCFVVVRLENWCG